MSDPLNDDVRARVLDRRAVVLTSAAGILIALCCVGLIASTALGAVYGLFLKQNVEQGSRPPTATLSVDADGCTVVRGEVESSTPVRALQWVVVDQAGRQVLARNALGEKRYTYYRPGKYDVVLQTFSKDRYIDISKHVTITCP